MDYNTLFSGESAKFALFLELISAGTYCFYSLWFSWDRLYPRQLAGLKYNAPDSDSERNADRSYVHKSEAVIKQEKSENCFYQHLAKYTNNGKKTLNAKEAKIFAKDVLKKCGEHDG